MRLPFAYQNKIKAMKIILSSCLLIFSVHLFAQKESFDLATYSAPKGWKKEKTESSVSFGKEDAKKGSYCLLILYKSVTSPGSSKENFDAAWESIVKDMLPEAAAPEVQASSEEDGWEGQTGYAPFEKEELKGVAMLVTMSGYQKMMNLLILTNTQDYQSEIESFLASVKLKKPVTNVQSQTTNNNKTNKTTVAKPAIASAFTFNTSNFDDGWIAVEQADWVEVTRSNIKVLVHYPNKKADEYIPDLLTGLKNAWNVLVVPRYRNITNLEFKPLHNWQSIEYAEADAVENSSGKNVHITFFKKHYSGGAGKYLEFITTDKNSFEKEFGAYNSDASSANWDKIANMATYNKFAVSSKDLSGKWTTNFSSMQMYVNAYTGLSAGATSYASTQTYEFNTSNTYKWNIGVASGVVGNLKFQGAKSAGKFSVPNNWHVSFSDIEGKPRTYDAFFVCIKGARVLWLDGTAFGKAE
jgi:hypothetical protein